MSIISRSSYSDMDKEILYDEYVNFKNTVNSYSQETPYYVYALCLPDGSPFYIGKGKRYRAFDHLKLFITGKTGNKWVESILTSLGDEPPIIFIMDGDLSENQSLELERKLILQYGRKLDGGSLCNIMPGGSISSLDVASYAGKIGGAKTKALSRGIFSVDYDRSTQTKSNWENGLMDHLDFRVIGALGGAYVADNQLGIHDPQYKDKRTEWAKVGAAASKMQGTFGCCDKNWRNENSEAALNSAANGGRIGGKIVGSMLWWNNGLINKKSVECPEGFIRGMIQSEKKKLSVSKNFNIKEKNYV